MANFIVEDIKRIFRGNGNILEQIIVLNVAAFIVFNIVDNFFPLTSYFLLPGTFGAFITQFWGLLTYMFIHAGFFHILFNMLWAYWIGRILLEYLGPQKFSAIYFLGGIAGGIAFLLLNSVLASTGSPMAGSGLVGASAAVMAIVAAVGTLLPNYTLHLFLIGPVRMKYLALGILVLTSIIDFSVNTGGKIAHLGGAAFGYLYIKALQSGKDIGSPYYATANFFKRLFTKGSKMKVTYRNTKTSRTRAKASSSSVASPSQEEIDRILDKISKSGYDSLTSKEKEILFKISKDK